MTVAEAKDAVLDKLNDASQGMSNKDYRELLEKLLDAITDLFDEMFEA